MRPFVFILFSVALANAKCHESGADIATQRTYAEGKIREACDLKFTIKKWSPGERLGICYNLDSTKKIDLVLERIGEGDDREIKSAECFDGFQKEINGCDYGGTSSYTNWKYSSDPNAGQCNRDN
ncbi:hypothetical protein FGRMN_9349 [Fusarium graminum]|nr:hypothetical protein FGRMN_9349 [Fusarium graminum]